MSVVKSVDVRASKMIEKKKTFILVFKNYSQIVQTSPRSGPICCCVAKLQELDFFGLLARCEITPGFNKLLLGSLLLKCYSLRRKEKKKKKRRKRKKERVILNFIQKDQKKSTCLEDAKVLLARLKTRVTQ
jgi:hypothetical protein